MARVKRGTTKLKRRRNVLKATKGYRWGRSKKERSALDAIFHAGKHAFAHRRDKKNDFRRLWNTRLNAALREHGTTYSTFMGKLKKANIDLNRKMLSELAAEEPKAFKALVEKVS